MSIPFDLFLAGLGTVIGFFVSIYLRRESKAKSRIFKTLEILAAEQKRHSEAITRIETELRFINGHRKKP